MKVFINNDYRHAVALAQKSNTDKTVTQQNKNIVEKQTASENTLAAKQIDVISHDDIYNVFWAPITSEKYTYNPILSNCPPIMPPVVRIIDINITPKPNMEAWKDLFALVDAIRNLSPDDDFEKAFRETAQFSTALSYALEEMKGQDELTDELKQEFAEELARYAPMSMGGEIKSLVEYAVIRISEIIRQSAPEEAREGLPTPAILPDDFTIGDMIKIVTKAFEDTMATGDFFNKSDASLWAALELVTSPERGLSSDGFYKYLKDNAQTIYADIKDQVISSPEKPFNLFGGLKAIIDTARKQYEELTPVTQMFSQKGLYSL